MLREIKVYPLTEGVTTQDSFAVLVDGEEFRRHKFPWRVWRALKEFGCAAYPVAEGLKRLEGTKIYGNLAELKDKVTVVVSCLPPERVPSLVADAGLAGVEKIWFQEKAWTPKVEQECEEAGLAVARGCVLRHRSYPAWSLCYFNPCYWHGLRAAKVPVKGMVGWGRK